MSICTRVVRFLVALIRRISLWQSMAVGIVLVAVWDGVGYASKGNSIASDPSLTFLRDSVPFGMRTHGVIMLLLAGAILYTMHDRPDAAQKVMWFTFLYGITIQCALYYGWYLSEKVTWSAPSKWILVSWIALVLQVRIDELNYGRVGNRNGE